MRIGLLTGEYPPMEGGVGAFTQALAKAMAPHGHELYVISHRHSRPPDLQLKANELNDPIDLGYAKLLARGIKWGRKDMRIVVDMIERYQLDLLNIQYQPSAFNMRSPAINMLPWRLKGLAKSVVTFHDLRTPYLFPKAGGLREKSVDFMARHADSVIVTNLADYQKLRAKRIASLNTVRIGSNVQAGDISAELINTTRAALGISKDDVLLAYFGFLNESKGADTLIDALAKLPKNHHLVFIGGQTGASDPSNNKSFLDSIKAQVVESNVKSQVHWTGFIDDLQVSAYLKSAELVVLPYHDGVSLRRGTLMAALAHGTAIITTPPLIPDDGLDDTHFAFAVAGDAVDLAETIEELLADPERCEMLRKNALVMAKRFTWDKIAEETLDIYAKALANP